MMFHPFAFDAGKSDDNKPTRKFQSEEHWMNFSVSVHLCGIERETGVSCILDGVYLIDIVGESWVVPTQTNGKWECSECMETGYSDVKEGYINPSFDTLETLLLDHMGDTLQCLEYLHTAKAVSLQLDKPGDIEHSNSAVFLSEERYKVRPDNGMFLIPIGAVTIAPCDDEVKKDAIAMQMYGIASYGSPFSHFFNDSIQRHHHHIRT